MPAPVAKSHSVNDPLSPEARDTESTQLFLSEAPPRRKCSRRRCFVCLGFTLVALVLLVCCVFLVADWECLTCATRALPPDYVPPAGGSVAARAASRDVRILSLNTFLRAGLITPNDFKSRRLEVLLGHFHNFDIVSLQEVWPLFSMGRLAKLISGVEKLGFRHWVRARCTFPLTGKLTNSMLFIASRHPLGNVEEYFYSHCSSTDCSARKGILAVRVTPFGDERCTFDFVATHLNAGNAGTWNESIVEPRGRKVRKLQLESLRQFANSRRTREGFRATWPTVIAGDFNMAHGTEEALEAAKGPLSGLVDLCAVEHGCEGRTARQGVEAVLVQGLEWPRLDYVLLDQREGSLLHHVKGSTYRKRFSTKDEPFTTVSDHFGLTSSLRCQ